MKSIKFAHKLFMIGFLLWTVNNFYFGWNFTPQSGAEERMDNIISMIYAVGFGIYMLPLLKIYRNWVQEMEEKNDNPSPEEKPRLNYYPFSIHDGYINFNLYFEYDDIIKAMEKTLCLFDFSDKNTDYFITIQSPEAKYIYRFIGVPEMYITKKLVDRGYVGNEKGFEVAKYEHFILIDNKQQ